MKSLLFILPLAFFIISCNEDSVSNEPQSEIILSEYFYPQPHSEWEYELYTIKSDGTIDYSNPVTEIHTRGEAPENNPDVVHINIENSSSQNSVNDYLISETDVKRLHIGEDKTVEHNFFKKNKESWLYKEETLPSKIVDAQTKEEIFFETNVKVNCERLEVTSVLFNDNEYRAIRFDYIINYFGEAEKDGEVVYKVDRNDTIRYTLAESLGFYSIETFPRIFNNKVTEQGTLLQLKSINK